MTVGNAIAILCYFLTFHRSLNCHRFIWNGCDGEPLVQQVSGGIRRLSKIPVQFVWSWGRVTAYLSENWPAGGRATTVGWSQQHVWSLALRTGVRVNCQQIPSNQAFFNHPCYSIPFCLMMSDLKKYFWGHSFAQSGPNSNVEVNMRWTQYIALHCKWHCLS